MRLSSCSREGDHSKKLDLIKEHGKSPQSDLLILIQTAFPIQESDKRKPLNTSTIESMSKLCKKLECRSKYISDEDRMETFPYQVQSFKSIFELSSEIQNMFIVI